MFLLFACIHEKSVTNLSNDSYARFIVLMSNFNWKLELEIYGGIFDVVIVCNRHEGFDNQAL